MRRGGAGFTLIELLVTIGLVAVLASLVLSALGGVRKNADRTAAIGNMRQIGDAILLHAADNDGTLPGPLWPGQIPAVDPGKGGRLAAILGPYLDGEQTPGLVPFFVPPAYARAVPAGALTNSRTFVMNMVIPVETAVLNPWGSLTDGSKPLRVVAVPDPYANWGFSDADQQHPRVSGASWSGNTPPEPIHEPHRLAWYFDGHVGSVETNELR